VISVTLSRLAEMLVTAMDRQGKGARRLEASFFRTDGAVRAIVVDTGQPATRAGVIGRLFRERLDALNDPLDPGFGFDLVRLSASRTEIVVQQQRDLDANVHDNDELAALIDRIAARIGGRRVVVHLPQDTHIPECAVLAASAQHHLATAMQAAWPARVESEPPLRPLRLFEKPEPIEVTAMFPDGPPARFKWRQCSHKIALVEGPERIAMEWWNHRELRRASEPEYDFTRLHPPQGDIAVEPIDSSALSRDYFRAEDEDGDRYWIYREGIHKREVRTFRWFLHGLFA
jgi:protein ImuB